MRIVHFVDSTDPQGTERHLLEAAEAQAQRGFEVLVVCPPGGWLPSALESAGLCALQSPVKRRDPMSLLRIRSRLLQFAPTVIHAHSERAAALAPFVTWPRKTPVLVTVHMPRFHPIYPQTAANGGIVIIVAEFLRNMLVGGGVPPERIRLVHNSTSLVRRPVGPIDVAKRTELGLPTDKVLFAMIARYCEDKGQHVAVAALANMKPDLRARVHFLFAGPSDPGWDARVKCAVEEAGLQDHVTLLGLRGDGPELIRISDVLVLPSAHEAFPISILEAMALAKPVIATNVGGVCEALEDGTTGIVIERKSESLINAIDRLVSHPEERENMGRNARQRAEKYFSPDAMNDAILSAYHEAAAR
jgi:glycosyltransferase involved in cell wall biosynthesis